MKRILLPAAAMAFLALMLGGCTMDGDKIVVTDPPRVTSNVTSSPAPVTPEAPSMTPNAPGGGHPTGKKTNNNRRRRSNKPKPRPEGDARPGRGES